MKKLIILVVMIVMSIASQNAMAQDKQKFRLQDGVMMKGGKMWVKKNGEKSEMTTDMTMSNGTKVTTNGTVVMTDGSTRILENGEMITMDGVWMDRKTKIKDNKIKMNGVKVKDGKIKADNVKAKDDKIKTDDVKVKDDKVKTDD